MRAWYCVQTKVKSEFTAAENLKRQKYEVYLPLAFADKRTRRRTTSETSPLFPGYLFVRLSTGSDDWRPIQSTRGVMTLVRFGDIPAPVPAEIIDALIAHENEQGIHQVFETDYRQGEAVKVIDGPFEFLDAVIHSNAKDRIFILLDILGNKTKVEVNYRDIEPMGEQT